MKIFITGGLGFVGRHLSRALLSDGHQVTAVGRSRGPSVKFDNPNFNYLSADTTHAGQWQKQLADSDIIINLAGRSIFTRWTPKVKQAIYDSRILTTRQIINTLPLDKQITLINTSAVGYYGDRDDEVLTETASAGNDFLARVSSDWEQEALKANSGRARVVLMRLGIVLDRSGGAMAKMVQAFRMFVGGRLGSGRQWFPWIHLNDLIAAYRFIIAHQEIVGPVNCCAPNPVRNSDLTKALADKLNRPAMFPLPAFAVKATAGEFADALLSSQRAQPAVLIKAGFRFTYPDIESALEEIVTR